MAKAAKFNISHFITKYSSNFLYNMVRYDGISALREIYFDGNYFTDFTYSTFVELFSSMGRNRVQHCLRQCLKTASLKHAVMLAIYLESELLFDELRIYCKARHTEAPLLAEYANLVGIYSTECHQIVQDMVGKYKLSSSAIRRLMSKPSGSVIYTYGRLDAQLVLCRRKLIRFQATALHNELYVRRVVMYYNLFDSTHFITLPCCGTYLLRHFFSSVVYQCQCGNLFIHGRYWGGRNRGKQLLKQIRSA